MADEQVTSVNGHVGNVTLTLSDLKLCKETWKIIDTDGNETAESVVLLNGLITFTIDGGDQLWQN